MTAPDPAPRISSAGAFEYIGTFPPVHESGVWELAFAVRTKNAQGDKALLAASGGGYDRHLVLWEVYTEPEARAAAPPAAVVFEADDAEVNGANDVCFSPDGSLLAVALDSKQVRIYKVTGEPPWRLEEVRSLDGHDGYVRSCRFCSSGKFLASSSGDNTVIVWDARQSRLLTEEDSMRLMLARKTESRSHVWTIRWSPSDDRLAAVGGDGLVRIYRMPPSDMLDWLDQEDFEVRLEKELGAKSTASRFVAVEWAPNARLLAALEKSVHIFDVETGDELAKLGSGMDVMRACFWSECSSYLTSPITNDKMDLVETWDVSTGRVLSTWYTTHAGALRAIAPTPDGQYAATASDDKQIKLFRVPPLFTFREHFASFLMASICSESDVCKHFFKSDMFERNLVSAIFGYLGHGIDLDEE